MQYIENLLTSIQPLTQKPWFWWAVGAAGVYLAFSIWKSVRNMPKMVVLPIVFATVVVVFMSWIYNRNEPSFMTPVVESIAPFFPEKGI